MSSPEASPGYTVPALVEDNLRLVPAAVRAVNAARSVPLDFEEAQADAAVGLVDAACKFNPGLGVPFSSYAPHRIKGEVVDGERRFHRLAGPRRQQASAVSQLNNTRARSLDAPLHVDTPFFTLYDVVPDDGPGPEEVAMDRFDVHAFYASLEPLTDRQREVVAHKARRSTLAQIAAALGISERTVSRDFQVARTFIQAHLQPTMFD